MIFRGVGGKGIEGRTAAVVAASNINSTMTTGPKHNRSQKSIFFPQILCKFVTPTELVLSKSYHHHLHIAHCFIPVSPFFFFFYFPTCFPPFFNASLKLSMHHLKLVTFFGDRFFFRLCYLGYRSFCITLIFRFCKTFFFIFLKLPVQLYSAIAVKILLCCTHITPFSSKILFW